MATVETCSELIQDTGVSTAYLIMDTESVPDGRLLSLIKYRDDNLSEEAAVERAQTEARESSYNGSDFLPVTFQYPVSVCVARVGTDFSLQDLRAIDAPEYRTRRIVEGFWKGVAKYSARQPGRLQRPRLDLPLDELAFRSATSPNTTAWAENASTTATSISRNG